MKPTEEYVEKMRHYIHQQVQYGLRQMDNGHYGSATESLGKAISDLGRIQSAIEMDAVFKR